MALKFPRRWPWSPLPKPPDPGSFAPASILLASEGSRIPVEAVEFAAHLSRKSKAPVHVFMIARIWGSAFGLPHPGLMPTKREWRLQHDLVAEAVSQLKHRGVEATGAVVSSRNAAGRILAEAKRRQPGAIVMGAPPPRHWLVADFIWEQEPYRVCRMAELPVYLIVEGQMTALPSPASAPPSGIDGAAFARPISEK
jgi:nucleotide-binding universal stress UspA family protein